MRLSNFVITIAFIVLLSGCSTLASKEATVACQSADVITTKIGLASGAHEANPLMRSLLAHGWGPVIAVKAGIVWLLTRDEVTPESRMVANAVSCGVVANNAAIILK